MREESPDEDAPVGLDHDCINGVIGNCGEGGIQRTVGTETREVGCCRVSEAPADEDLAVRLDGHRIDIGVVAVQGCVRVKTNVQRPSRVQPRQVDAISIVKTKEIARDHNLTVGLDRNRTYRKIDAIARIEGVGIQHAGLRVDEGRKHEQESCEQRVTKKTKSGKQEPTKINHRWTPMNPEGEEPIKNHPNTDRELTANNPKRQKRQAQSKSFARSRRSASRAASWSAAVPLPLWIVEFQAKIR